MGLSTHPDTHDRNKRGSCTDVEIAGAFLLHWIFDLLLPADKRPPRSNREPAACFSIRIQPDAYKVSRSDSFRYSFSILYLSRSFTDDQIQA